MGVMIEIFKLIGLIILVVSLELLYMYFIDIDNRKGMAFLRLFKVKVKKVKVKKEIRAISLSALLFQI